MCGYVWSDYRSYLDLIQEFRSKNIGIVPLEAYIRRVRLTYAAHVARMDNTRHAKIIMYGEFAGGARSSGRSEQSWRHALKSDLIKFGICTLTWQILCQDRVGWRKLVNIGEEFFIQNWIQEKAQSSIKRHLKESLASGTANVAVLPDVGVVAVLPSVVAILPEDEFSAVENAINDHGRVVAGRGAGGKGATVSVGRGRKERGKNNKCLISQTSWTNCKLAELQKELILPVQSDKKLYCVCQLRDDGSLYIICSQCGQSYHPKCVNYNVGNNHAILTKDYKCGYCLKSKYWPVSSSRPPFVSAQVSAIIPAVLLTGTSLRSVRKRSRVPITRDEVLDWENEN